MRLIASLLLLACQPPLYRDPGPFPFQANDTTALLVGCGERAARGHLYCRFTAGALPTGSVVIVVPPVKCAASSCASVTIWAPDASIQLERIVPKGQAYVVIPWASLVGPGPFTEAQRGFWPVLVKWAWTDSSGVELAAAAEGEIRLRVTRKDYAPPTSHVHVCAAGSNDSGA